MPAATPIRRADYAPPAWRVRHARLLFDLDPEATVVEAELDVEPWDGDGAGALELDGEDLALLSLSVDGAEWPRAQWSIDGTRLRIQGLGGACTVRTRVRIAPSTNTRLEGLYVSRGLLITQCEAEGFRRITWFPDRPDVMCTWTTTLRADAAAFPVLLGNGNPAGTRRLDDGRHEATWHNPHPTPAYLFALVAGRLEAVRRSVRTAEGREVELAVWAAPADLPRCGFALDSVERALRWDEQRFGRCYDLDVFNIVAAQDFNMGAMENKGLNIFNARYILADPDTATDLDFLAVEAVIGHEYFHNWSGNRVTLRDWFQLSLKEGLTVFRDQEFTADLHSRAVKRIEDVRLLRARQFAEDAGSLAHPVRPAEYTEINNFYTLTVYEKGAEIVRMLHTVLGEAAFRAGLDRYFADNDGRAATVEDFIAALEAASGRDLQAWLRWYAQAGTPRVAVQARLEERRLVLAFTQSTPATPGQPEKQALPVPLRLAVYGDDGRALDLAGAQVDGGVLQGDLLLLQGERTTLRLPDVAAMPLPVFNQGFSAPVQLAFDHDLDQLARIVAVEADAFSRWEAVQRLALRALLPGDGHEAAMAGLIDALGALLDDAAADPAFLAECLVLPDFDTLCGEVERIDVDGLLAAREEALDRIAEAHAEPLERRYRSLASATAGGLTGEAMAARRLRGACLSLLTRLDPTAALAQAAFETAEDMSTRLGALRCLVHFDAPGAEAALSAFARRHGDDPLVVDKRLGVVVTRPDPDALDAIDAILASPDWEPGNPNRVRAVLGGYSRANPVAFHRADGAGYRLLADQLERLDPANPQVAARLLGAFERWRRLDPGRQALARAQLERLRGSLRSRDCGDLLQRLLA